MYINDFIFLPKSTMRFKGGGGASAVAAAPTPTPAPPVSMSNSDVVQAQKDIAQQELLKKNIKKTIYAGDTGGWKPQGNPFTKPPGAPDQVPMTRL